MKNSINSTSYVEMLLNSSDDFEPYGYVATPGIAADALGMSEANLMLHRETLIDEPWGE